MLLPPDNSTPSGNTIDASMVPAINIVFLLLIFFMIAGHIESRSDQLRIPESASDTVRGEEELSIQITASGKIFIDGSQLKMSLNDYFRELEGSSTIKVICHVHRNLPASALDPVLEAAQLFGIKQLQIATEQHQ